jgi:hypothetical protein
MLMVSPVWLPPILQGCRPNNFREYSVLGGVASSSSGELHRLRPLAAFLTLAARVLAVAGERDHSLGVFAVLATEFVFVDDTGTAWMGALLGSRHGYRLHSLPWMQGRK